MNIKELPIVTDCVSITGIKVGQYYAAQGRGPAIIAKCLREDRIKVYADEAMYYNYNKKLCHLLKTKDDGVIKKLQTKLREEYLDWLANNLKELKIKNEDENETFKKLSTKFKVTTSNFKQQNQRV